MSGLGLHDLDPDLVERALSALQLERDRRNGVFAAPSSRWAIYRDDPVGFFNNVLDYELWSKQREICDALIAYDRVAVKSCHQSGKSFTCGGIVPWWIAVHPPKEAIVVTTAPTFQQVRAILWREINRAHARGKLIGYTNQTEWLIDNELVAFGRKPQDEDPTAFQGIHARYLLVVVDEACGVVRNMFIAAESLAANKGAKILAIGNPDDPSSEFARICKPGSGWHTITISAFDTPNLTGEPVSETVSQVLVSREWVEDKKRAWGETSPIYVSKVLGEFPDVTDDALIQTSWVVDAVHREIAVAPNSPNELGVDVARFGRNETVIYHRHGAQARLWRAVRQRDTMAVVQLIVRAVVETGATRVKIDDIGLGGGVVDRCKELARTREIEGVPNSFYGVTVIGVNVATAPLERAEDRRAKLDPRTRYANQKAQLSWELRERFRLGEIDLDDDLDTQAQICAIRYDYINGRLRIESKEDVEDRLGKIGGISAESGSPDRWDALVLAFAEVEERVVPMISDRLLAMSRQTSRSARY